jgi:hypothetical protein
VRIVRNARRRADYFKPAASGMTGSAVRMNASDGSFGGALDRVVFILELLFETGFADVSVGVE